MTKLVTILGIHARFDLVANSPEDQNDQGQSQLGMNKVFSCCFLLFTGDKVITDDQEHTKEKDKGGQGIDTKGNPLTRT